LFYFNIRCVCYGSVTFQQDPSTTASTPSLRIQAQDPHDPGAPPHRPQVGGPSLTDALLPLSLLTANTLSLRAVFFDPHSGQLGFGPSDIVR
jgi:hypothetical protein